MRRLPIPPPVTYFPRIPDPSVIAYGTPAWNTWLFVDSFRTSISERFERLFTNGNKRKQMVEQVRCYTKKRRIDAHWSITVLKSVCRQGLLIGYRRGWLLPTTNSRRCQYRPDRRQTDILRCNRRIRQCNSSLLRK